MYFFNEKKCKQYRICKVRGKNSPLSFRFGKVWDVALKNFPYAHANTIKIFLQFIYNLFNYINL